MHLHKSEWWSISTYVKAIYLLVRKEKGTHKKGVVVFVVHKDMAHVKLFYAKWQFRCVLVHGYPVTFCQQMQRIKGMSKASCFASHSWLLLYDRSLQIHVLHHRLVFVLRHRLVFVLHHRLVFVLRHRMVFVLCHRLVFVLLAFWKFYAASRQPFIDTPFNSV